MEIAEIKQLQELEIDDKAAKTRGGYQHIFKNLKQLCRLEMRQPDLKRLNVGSCSITDKQLNLLVGNLPRLTLLDVAGNRLTDAAARSLVRLPDLRELSISSNPIRDGGALLLAGLNHLTILRISSTKIGRQGLLALCCGLGSLVQLDIGNNNYGDEEAAIVTRHLSRLEMLSSSQGQLGGEAIFAVASSLLKLKELYLCRNEGIGQGSGALGRLPALKELLISETGLKNRTVVALAAQLRGLKVLWMDWNDLSAECKTLVQEALPEAGIQM